MEGLWRDLWRFSASPRSAGGVTTAPVPLADSALHRRFRDAARAAGMDPDNRWVGGYVAYEWNHLARLLAAYDLDPAGSDVVELGCNVGGSTVVMAALGGRVTGVDIDPSAVAVAQANIALHNVADRARALAVPDSRALPFADGAFDLAVANSVLEYVDPAMLPGVLDEVARVLRPGGRLFVCGTASRLAPFAVHDGRWGVNYLPRRADRWMRRPPFRGLSPFALRLAFGRRFAVEGAECWLAARAAVHGRASVSARALAATARAAGLAPGWISPTIELRLRRL